MIQNIKRQVSVLLLVMTPPISGPATAPTPYRPSIIASSIARFSKAAQYDVITVDPLNKPAAPKPAIALPTVSMIEFGATAQMTEPSSKTSNIMI